VVRESVGGAFGASTGVNIGTGLYFVNAGTHVCILLVPSCAAWCGTVMHLMVPVFCTGTMLVLCGILQGIVPYDTGVWYCVLFVPVPYRAGTCTVDLFGQCCSEEGEHVILPVILIFAPVS
jgi:hypothetical protein